MMPADDNYKENTMKRTSTFLTIAALLTLGATARAAVTCDSVKRNNCTGPANELITELRVGVEYDGSYGTWTYYGYILPATSTVLNTLNCGGNPKVVTLAQSNWPQSANQVHASILQAMALNRTITFTVAAGSASCALNLVAIKSY